MDNQRFEELLIREFTDEITESERQQLAALLQSDASYRNEYEIFKDYWSKKETTLSDTRAVLEKVKDRIRTEEKTLGQNSEYTPATPVKTLPRRLLLRRSAAAIIILGIGTLAYRYISAAHSPAVARLDWQEKYTARKTRSQLVLSDGSTVMLNADTRLRFPTSFDGAAREVYLTGEAFFDIQKDPLHPFIIHTDKMNIRVLGTAFNVRSYPGDASMETTLLRGSIEVTFPDRPSDRIILKPKDKLVISNHTPAADSIIAAQPANRKITVPAPLPKYTLTGLTYYPKQDSTVIETSWVDNKLAFRSEEFQSIARRMERWYGVKIVFDNPALAAYSLTGIFQKNRSPKPQGALQLSEGFSYTIQNGIIPYLLINPKMTGCL